MRWTGHVACMGDRQGVCVIFSRRHDGKPHLEGLSIDGTIILKGSARRGMGAWTVVIAVVNL